MKRKEVFLSFVVFFAFAIVFFYKFFFQGLLPFPGDLLVSEYKPWQTYSYIGYNPGAFPSKGQYFDVLRQLYPWKTLTIDLLKSGILPLWNPYNFSGAPLLANFQSAVFYPFNILYFFVPQITAWTALIIAQPLFACFFTYLFAKKIGIRSIGAFFAAISYGFSSFITVWLEYNTIGHVILWLPLALLAVEELLPKFTGRWSIVFIISLTFSLFAGHPQVFVYLFVFVAAYLLYRLIMLKKQKFFYVVFSFLLLLVLGIGSIQLVPGIELIRESARSAHSYDFLIQKILVQPWQLAMLFVPDFFGNPATRNYWPEDTYVGKVTSIGLIPLFFVLFTLLRKRNQFVLFFQAAALVILLLVTSNPLTQLLYKIELPLISASSPTLAIFIFCFSLSILCGFGIDKWQSEESSFRRFIRWATLLIVIFIVLWVAVVFIERQYALTAFRNLLYETVVLMVALAFLVLGVFKKNMKLSILVVLLLIHSATLWRSFNKFNPFVPKELVFSQTPILAFLQEQRGFWRFWGYGTASIGANIATQYQLFSPDGYDPLYPRRYGEFIQSSKDGKIKTKFTRENRSDAVIEPGFGEEDLPANVFRLRVLDLLGVKYILDRVENGSTEKTFPGDRFTLLHEENGWRILENKKALPRTFLVVDYKVFKDSQDFENIFFARDFDPSKTVLLEEPLLQDFEISSSLGEASILSYQPNNVFISTKSQGDALLFLSDTYYSGWEAFIDSQPTKVYRANYAFRAIFVPKGEHAIRFTYNPQWNIFTATISKIVK